MSKLLLSDIYQEVRICTKCDLCQSRTQVVFGYGNEHADIMFIGEAPGANEDKQGIPFCGAAGKRLDAALENIGLERENVYIANVLKCRPPSNRNPKPEEIELCTPYLEEQIRCIEPKIIVPMGTFAAQYILGTDEKISNLRGKVFEADAGIFSDVTCKIAPILHPAATLHNPNLRDVFNQDFENIKTICKNI